TEPVRPAEPVEPPRPAEPGEPARPGERPGPEPPRAGEPVTPVEGKPGVFQVNEISALKATEPSLLSLADRSIWRWELYVELPGGQRAVFCEVNLRPSPYGGTSPDLNLHPKVSTVRGGAPVELRLQGAKWTTEALRLTIETHRAKFGHAPRNMGGWLAESNLRNFQDAFARLRSENPGLSSAELGEMAVREISFGKQRGQFGYVYFKVTIARVGRVRLSNGSTEVVPTVVRVEASQTPIRTGRTPKLHPPSPEPGPEVEEE
ncbi:MAG: hypothetical protein AB1941_21880, partial [Gemmatimonadota bacterium]